MTAEYWQYDARVGRRWGIDLIHTARESPYLAIGSNPVYYKDLLGNFKTRFGAWLHSVWKGGHVGKNKYGEFFVSKTSSSSSSDGDVSVKVLLLMGMVEVGIVLL